MPKLTDNQAHARLIAALDPLRGVECEHHDTQTAIESARHALTVLQMAVVAISEKRDAEAQQPLEKP